ncbi:MAG: S-methyl-5-thioribose-1-phosphate isomerase [bacterium]|nr:S-methyl-5-thioribose-1-phosphate isomerase [bacterium]
MNALPFPFPVVTWDDQAVVLIDQTLLPEQIEFRRCNDIPSLCLAISELAVRGAPAIGVAAGFGLVLSWRLNMVGENDPKKILEQFLADKKQLAATRPTAVNLFWALDRVGAMTAEMVTKGESAESISSALFAEAQAILDEDVAMCRSLGMHGQELLRDYSTVLTHCNAGGLATGGYGTAVGVVFAAKESGKSISVFADETRPLLQGARLTAWELQNQGIEVTVVCDSAAATLLSQGKVDAVITGADRIAANGDAANKIGTYPLAVLADRHGIPFYVAAPGSTFDAGTETGQDIAIELRDPGEVHQFHGGRATPEGVAAWNPAFDVTPNDLITAIISEHGIIRPPYRENLAKVWGSE